VSAGPLTPGELLGHSVRTAGAVVSWLSIAGGLLAIGLGVIHKGEPGAMAMAGAGIAGMLWGWWLGAISRGGAHLLARRP